MSDETVDDIDDFDPITSQEQLDRIIGQRIDRVKKQFAGFDELKAKAAQFDDLQEASKSELQRERERAAQLEQELAAERHNALKATVAAAKGVPASALSGTTREELEASGDALLEWRAEQKQAKSTKSVRGLKSGVLSDTQAMDPKERAAAAIRSLRSHD